MSTFTRRNAWNQGGTFSNPDLLWYAKAVRVMQSRSLDDETSWWFYAAIHGMVGWEEIIAPPSVPTSPLPSQSKQDQYWNQCQHGSWFFLPWHRGYLYAIENILRGIIVSLGGPHDWALPYWNYFDASNQYTLPPAFMQEKLDDGTPNPLYVKERYGPNEEGYIPNNMNINQDCQTNKSYEGVTPSFYGGSKLDIFVHFSSEPGSLESNPHNKLHNAIGGPGTKGLMADADKAGLDPIFYLHHCNIDRLWASWNANGHTNPTDQDWLSGPVDGDRKFYMPKPDKSAWLYTPSMVTNISQLGYTYEDLSLEAATALVDRNAVRLRNFGLELAETTSENMKPTKDSVLIGANTSSIVVGSSGLLSNVKLNSNGWNGVSKSINKLLSTNNVREVSSKDIPDTVYLQLEGVKGTQDSIVCSVSVNNQYVDHITLFGIKSASSKDSGHGNGLTILLDITPIVDQLHLNNAAAIDSLEVLIQPVHPIAEGNEFSVERISIYSKTQ